MAQVVRGAYTKLTEHRYAPAYPAAGQPRSGDQQGPRARYGATVADLIKADLLPGGTTLRPAQRDLDAIATVLPDGKDRLRRRNLRRPVRSKRRSRQRISQRLGILARRAARTTHRTPAMSPPASNP
jgi:hypothetical protein